MTNQLLEHEVNSIPVIEEESPCPPSLAPTLGPSHTSNCLVFEWQTGDDDCDLVTWRGDIDAALGLPEGAFPRTFTAWINALHPDDQDVVLSAIEAHLLSDEPYSIECRACHADGHLLRWRHSGSTTRDEKGAPLTFFGYLEDLDAQSGVAEEGDEQQPEADEGADEIKNQPITLQSEPYLEAFPHAESVAVSATPLALEENVSSDQRALEEQARAQSLLRAAAHLNAQLDLQDVCEAICQEAGRTIGAPSAVMLFNKVRDAFVPSAVRGMPANYDKRYIPTPRYVYEGHVAEMGTLFLFTDAQATPDLPNAKLYKEVNMRTIGIASLIREGEVLGLLKVYSFVESRTFTTNELALLQGLADIAAQAIANARLLAESERRLANLGALRQIDKAILGSSDVNIALNVVLEQVESRMGADASSALLLEPHSRTLRYAVGRGFRTNIQRGTEWQMGEGLAGRAALERSLVYVPDLNAPDFANPDLTPDHLKLPDLPAGIADPAMPPLNLPSRRTGVPANEGFVSYFGLPLIANGKVQGVLEMWHRSPLHLEEEDLEFLETLAGQAAIAVDNATLFRDLQRSNDELALAYDSTLAGWSGALDLRDKETEGHSERVTRETLRLAREMGVSDAEMVHIRRGALLHDIGKMGVPDAILLKPGPLSDEEWVIMKQHPSYALQLLAPIEYLRPALDIPYAHHEKWDGSGYPRGLSGEQIPLHARMFAIVDVWDALCSDRPYRKGWPIQRVLNHIREGSGTHFDPAVVEAFLRLHEQELALPEVTETEAASEPQPVSEPSNKSSTEAESSQPSSWLVRLWKTLWGWGGADS